MKSLLCVVPLLGCSMLLPAAEEKGDMMGNSTKSTVGPYGLTLAVSNLTDGMQVPVGFEFANPTAKDVCFDRIQITGTGDGKHSFVFSLFRTAYAETFGTPQNKIEAPPLQTKFFWKVPGGAGVRIPGLVIRNLDWVGSAKQQLKVRLMLSPAPEHQGCGAPPAEPFLFKGK